MGPRSEAARAAQLELTRPRLVRSGAAGDSPDAIARLVLRKYPMAACPSSRPPDRGASSPRSPWPRRFSAWRGQGRHAPRRSDSYSFETARSRIEAGVLKRQQRISAGGQRNSNTVGIACAAGCARGDQGRGGSAPACLALARNLAWCVARSRCCSNNACTAKRAARCLERRVIPCTASRFVSCARRRDAHRESRSLRDSSSDHATGCERARPTASVEVVGGLVSRNGSAARSRARLRHMRQPPEDQPRAL
jgi:hypothetical protein